MLFIVYEPIDAFYLNSTCKSGQLLCTDSQCNISVECPRNQVYRTDMSPCGGTCADLDQYESCRSLKRIEGCGCLEGLVLNDEVGWTLIVTANSDHDIRM